MSATAPVDLSPANLTSLFESFGVLPPPDSPPTLVHSGANEQMMAPWEDLPAEPLDTDASTIYQAYADEPDHPPYTSDDIPGVLVNVIHEARAFLNTVRATPVSNRLKNDSYYNVKWLLRSVMGGLVGQTENLQTCWQEPYNTLLGMLDFFDEQILDRLEMQLDSCRMALADFIDWIYITNTPHGLGSFETLHSFYLHYIRHELRAEIVAASDVEAEGEEVLAGAEFENLPLEIAEVN